VYDRGNSGVPGERECKRKKNDGEIQMWEQGERKQVCGSSEMREREGKERGEILNEDGRGDKMDERDMEEERKEREGERGRIGIKKLIFGNF
jgi:hypothetical protein